MSTPLGNGPASPAPPRLGAIARARGGFRALLASHLAPHELFWALFVGAMVGATPFYGFHIFICVALGWLLRLNTPAIYAAANISIPPLIPLLGFASVQLGERLLHHRWLPLGVAQFRAMAHGPGGVRALMLRFFVDWTAGGLLVGAAIGLAFGTIALAITRRRHAIPTPSPDDATQSTIDAAITEAARRYRHAPRNLRYYAFFKYRMDPSYRRIAALVPPGTLTIDLGTGLGMLPLVLALLPGDRAAIGVDWDAAKLAAGRAAAADLPRVTLTPGDARDFPLPPCDVVTLVDVLHYYDPEAQRALLSRATDALRPGGSLLVREGDAGRRGTARWTRALEALAVRIGWNRGHGATRFRGASTLCTELESLGLTVTTEPLAGPLHPGNVLLRAQKPAP